MCAALLLISAVLFWFSSVSQRKRRKEREDAREGNSVLGLEVLDSETCYYPTRDGERFGKE